MPSRQGLDPAQPDGGAEPGQAKADYGGFSLDLRAVQGGLGDVREFTVVEEPVVAGVA